MKSGVEIRMPETEAGRHGLGRDHPLPAQKQFLGEGSEGETQRRGRGCEEGRTTKGAPQRLAKLAIGHRVRRDDVERTGDVGLADGVEDHPHAVVQRDP
ncbi:MAG TPA: hypothetical protein VEC04_00160 [Brevundimonas sp.]|nr:hypothetical protein [Brevundimonas sp.]HYC73233.1 hypothetical protein [Brevundimonas sp.]